MNPLPFRTRLLLFFYSTRNIVGCILALIGLALFFGGVIRDWWLPIVLGLYAVGLLAVPRDRSAEIEAQTQLTNAELLDKVDDIIRQSRKRLPAEATERLVQIREVLASLMPKLQGLADAGTIAMDQTFTLVGAIGRDLPTTIANYLRLPQAYAAVHPVEGGKTAKVLLIEQLDLLRGTLARIADSAYKEDAEALVVNGRYLKEKFHSYDFLAS